MSEQSESNTNCLDAKVVLVGESGVGKTSIIKQFTAHSFDPFCPTSISSQFTSKIVNIGDTKKAIRFDLWDTAGQEKYRSIAKIFYKDAKIIMFVYEIINKKSFESLKDYWYKEVSSICLSDSIFAVVANKNDLYNISEVDEKEAMDWADSIGAIFQETSAKSNTGIDLLFDMVGKKCLNANYNYKSEEEMKKKIFEMKKKNKEKENEDEDNTNIQNIPDVTKIKIQKEDDKINENKKCC